MDSQGCRFKNINHRKIFFDPESVGVMWSSASMMEKNAKYTFGGESFKMQFDSNSLSSNPIWII